MAITEDKPQSFTKKKFDGALWIAGGILAGIILVSVFAPELAPHNPLTLFPSGLNAQGGPLGPSTRFPLGTDQYGRDELSRLLYGGRSALLITFVASALSASLGMLIGVSAGNLGGGVDLLSTRLINVLMSFPITLFAVAMVMILRPSILNLIIILSVIYWTYTARLVRAEVLSLKNALFIEAAISQGATNWHIIWRHLAPNVLNTIVARFTLSVAQMFLMEASLSYLGVGVQPPTPDWGLMISQSQGFYQTDPGLVLYPGLCIVLTVLATSTFSRALQKRLRGGGRQ
jgi:ABC-type dipeptide/oligopeptide/nickel transport system permease subunit